MLHPLPHCDYLATVGRLTDGAGTTVETDTYKPYGTRSTALTPGSDGVTPSGPEAKGFTGERDDPEVGLLYLHARYYDPKLGIFVSPDGWDPLLPGAGTNRYGYADDDPINRADRNGHGAAGGCNASCAERNRRDLETVASVVAAAIPGSSALDAFHAYEEGQYRAATVYSIQAAADVVTTVATGGAFSAEKIAIKTGAEIAEKTVPQVTKNYIQGKVAEKFVQSELEKQGENIAARQATIETSIGRRRVDIVTRDENGKFGLVEVKSGQATRSPLQIEKDAEIEAQGGIARGERWGRTQNQRVQAPTREVHHDPSPKPGDD